jgi:hypothetical protein
MTTAVRCGDEVLLSRCADDGFVSAVFSFVCISGWLCSILKGEEMSDSDRLPMEEQLANAKEQYLWLRERFGPTGLMNDRKITAFAKNGMITPFAEGIARPGVISYGVTSFGYDMRVADEWVRYAA